ncbi:hypothetical protein [Microbacterium sp. ZOR0019]|uniref:hypothetical protein n=1 Tax=Microbacterium sp. ZOR0019 TaxID=1339233 RepID=UPI00064783E7|nr:hypothetical protein [Microbacterium sp. ZOR0019]
MATKNSGAAKDSKSERPTTLKRAPRPAADQDVDPVDTPATSAAPAPAPAEPTTPRTGKKRGPYNVQRVNKVPASYRLPPDVIELIDTARNEAAERGDRLTKDEAITMAVRSFWGKRRQRR